MYGTIGHAAAGGHKGLAEHLSAKNLRAADVPALTAKDVQLDRLKLEHAD